MSTKYKPRAGDEFKIGYPSLHPGQQIVAREAEAILAETGGFLEAYLCAHRGWWKSSFVLRRMLMHLRTEMPGAWYAPTMKPITDTIENLFKKAVGEQYWGDFYNESKKILRLPGCGPLHFYSLLEDDAGRGPTFPFMVGDEWGTLPDGVHQSVIKPIMRKAQVAYQGKAEGWFCGTPNSKGNPKNHFYHNLQRGIQRSSKGRVGWIIPASAQLDPMTDSLIPWTNPYANPYYNFDDMADDYKDADRKAGWLIEWLCMFISDEGGQFERDAIESQCVLPWEVVETPITDTSFKPLPIDPNVAGKRFVSYMLRGHKSESASWVQIGIDLGVSNDKVSIHVVDRMKMRQLYAHHFLPFGRDRWFLVYEAIAQAARLFPGAKIVVDATGMGSHVIETMRRTYGIRMEGVKFGGMNKEPILNHASSMIEKGNVWLFSLQFIKDELGSVQRKVRASGSGYDIRARGKDAHDDAPMAISLMLHGVYPLLVDGEDSGIDRIPYCTSESVASPVFAVIDGETVGAGDDWHAFLST